MISKFSLTLSIISCNVSSKGESVHYVWQYLVWCVIENLHFKWDATLTSHFMYFLVRNYEEFTRNIRHTKMLILSLRHCFTCLLMVCLGVFQAVFPLATELVRPSGLLCCCFACHSGGGAHASLHYFSFIHFLLLLYFFYSAYSASFWG